MRGLASGMLLEGIGHWTLDIGHWTLDSGQWSVVSGR